MADQTCKAEQFRALHIPGKPLVLFNIWDAGSARAVAATGVKAVATGSWSVANAHGFADGPASHRGQRRGRAEGGEAHRQPAQGNGNAHKEMKCGD